ncbi:MAG: hypothetical protein E7Z93_03915 [Cyanobacteria bacterium SIG32]|nr:hypothetical protein [Cyanobacteria bacterium SIG32]
METRHFTFPNGCQTTLYKTGNTLLLMNRETGKTIASKHYNKDASISRSAYNNLYQKIRQSTIIPASKETLDRTMFDIVDGPLSMRGEIDRAGNVVECWKNNIGDAVEKLGPLAKKILKRI